MSNDIQPAKRGRPARSQEQTVELIVSGATRLLLSQGYSATTMEGVAAHCGLAKKPCTASRPTEVSWWAW